MAVGGSRSIDLRGVCHRSDAPTAFKLVAGEEHVGIEFARPWFHAYVAVSYGDLLRLQDEIGNVLAEHGPKPVTVKSLGGAEQMRVACACGWDDGGELHVVDIRHPDGFAMQPLNAASPLKLYGDEGQAAAPECPDCSRGIRIGTVVARKAVTA